MQVNNIVLSIAPILWWSSSLMGNQIHKWKFGSFDVFTLECLASFQFNASAAAPPTLPLALPQSWNRRLKHSNVFSGISNRLSSFNIVQCVRLTVTVAKSNLSLTFLHIIAQIGWKWTKTITLGCETHSQAGLGLQQAHFAALCCDIQSSVVPPQFSITS